MRGKIVFSKSEAIHSSLKSSKRSYLLHKELRFFRFALIGVIGGLLIFLPAGRYGNSTAWAVYEEASGSVSAPSGATARQGEFVPGEILVRYEDGQTPAELAGKAAERAQRAETAFGVVANRLEDIRMRANGEKPPEEVLKEITQVKGELDVVETEHIVDNLFLVKSRKEIPPGLFISRFRSLSNVERVQPNYYYQILAAPNDPRYASGELWGMRIIQAEGAWDQSRGSKNILAAVVDAGIDPNHEDIAANMVEFKDFAGCSAYYTGHGTHVAGTIGAVGNNGKGVVGVNWEVGILGMNIDCDGDNLLTSKIIRGTRYAVDAGARVINYSFGGPGSNPELAEEINRAVQQGVVVVVSAGNTPGPYADVLYPASDPNVITVSATGPNDELAHYSSYGNAVDVAAPGGNPPGGSSTCAASSADCILSSWPSNRYKAIAGTSMAAPHVTGLVALMLAKNPGLSAGEVKRIMYDTADDKGPGGWDQKFGNGRINANRALAAITGGGPTATPQPTATGPIPTATPTTTQPTPSTTPPGSGPTGEPSATPIPINCPVNGDYNGDGRPDILDYEEWQADYSAGPSASSGAALACFEYWRRATFGFGGPGPEPTATPTSSPPDSRRGHSGDLWADIVLGQPDFAQGIPKEIVSFKVAGPGGVVVDKSAQPNRIYVYDGMNSRVLGYSSLGVCENNESRECSTDSDCPGSVCSIRVGGESGMKKADIVLGQSDFNSSACNGDGTFLAYPARTPASDRTLCSLPPDAPSPFEYGSFASMAVDSDGNLYVPDFFNNRVLRFNKPFATDTIADEVWGQDDFSGFACNKGGVADNSTFCFEHSTPNNPLTAGVDIDLRGNLWIADAGNNRVLRFPFSSGRIAQEADLVLGQADFASNSSGSSLTQLYTPVAVRVAADGRVFVADTDNNRVLIYDPPLANGMAGREFAGSLKKPTGIEFDIEGNGVWVVDTNNNQLVLFTDEGDVRKVLVKDTYRPDGVCGNPGASCPAWSTGYDKCNLCDSRGSIGITSVGDVIVPASSSFQNVYLYKHPIPMPNPGNPYPAIAQFFAPPTGHNYLSNKGFVGPRGIAVTEAQLVIADAQRIMFWNIPNGIDDLATGKAADGVVGVPDFKTFVDPHYGRVAAGGGSLWALRKDRVEQYILPLSLGEMPARIIYTKDLKIIGSGNSVGREVEATGIYADPQGRYLWLALPYSDRVVRVRTPESTAGDFVIDVIIGGNDIPAEDRRWHRPCPPEKSLCAPGAVTEDQRGHLYIADYFLENEGSGRFFRFAKELFPENNSSLLLYDTTHAAQKFTDVYGWEPAFDSQNRMVIGGAAFTSRYGLPFVYYDILTQTGSSLVDDAQLSDHFTQSFSAKFDSADNLYITDMNRGRVLIYKQPLTSP